MKKFIVLTLTVMLVLFGASTANAWVVRAKNVRPNTGSFGGHLSSADNTVQKALDTLDDITAGGDITGVGDATSGDALDGSSDGGTYIRLYDGSAHYTEIQGPSVSGNTTFIVPGYNATAPASDGSAGQFIQTDGSGAWSFATAAGGGTVTTFQEGDVDVDANADPSDIVTVDFGTGFSLAETPNTEINVTLDVTPSAGSATLVVEQDSIQVKFDTTDFQESTNGLYLGDSPTIATSLAFGAEAADAGALRLSNATDIVWEHSTPGTDIVALGVDSSQIVQIAASGSAGVTITPALTLSSSLTDGTATLNSGAWSAITTLAMTGALSGPTSITITAAAPALTLADSTATTAGTMDFKADALTATYDAIMRFYVDDDTGEDNLYMTIDGTNEEILFAENLDLTSTGIENVGNLADDAAFSVISASGAVTVESVVFTGGALTGITHSDGLTIGDGGSSHYLSISDTGAMTFTGNADINLPDDSVDTADIGTDQVTMDAIDSDGTFTSLTGAWTTTGALGAGDTTITSADPILSTIDSTSADGTGTLYFAATGANETVAEIQVDEGGNAVTYIELDGINTDVEIKKALVTSSTSDLSAGNVTLGVIVGNIDSGGATGFELPNGSSGTTNLTGEIYLDTDGDGGQYGTPSIQISTNDTTTTMFAILIAALPQDADDNKILKFNAATDAIGWEADDSAGTTKYNAIADADADGSISFDDGEEAVYTSAQTAADQFSFIATGAFGDISIVKIAQNTGDPTDGTLLELISNDANVDELLIAADAAAYTVFNQTPAGGFSIDITSDGTPLLTIADEVSLTKVPAASAAMDVLTLSGTLAALDADDFTAILIDYDTTADHQTSGTIIMLEIDALDGDAEIDMYGIRIGNMANQAKIEQAIEIGTGWDCGIDFVDDTANILHSGATSLTIASTSGTVIVESVTFTGAAVSGASTLAMTGALSGATTVELTHTAPTITLIDTTAGTGATNVLFASSGANDVAAAFQVDEGGGAVTYFTLDGVNDEILFAEKIDLTSMGIENSGTISDDASIAITSSAGGVTLNAQANDQDVVFNVDDGGTNWAVTIDGSEGTVIIGDGDAFDHILKFDANTADGTITWDQDPGEWDFAADINSSAAATFTTVTVDTEVYGAGWDGDNTAPTKDATYDKIQAISGDITDVGPGYASGAAFTDGVASTGTSLFIWEGSTVDTVEFIIAGPADPTTSDSTVTFREASGTVLISGDTLTGHATATFDTDGSTATTVVDFALNTAADAGDGDIASISKLEGLDAAIYLELGVDTKASLVADASIELTSLDVIQYIAVNNANPEYRMGSADAEEAIIQIVYDSGAQGVDYLLIQTQTADATADEGRIIFSVDEVTIATFDDGGIELGISKVISGTTRVTIGDNGQEVVVNSSDWDIDETGAITGVSFADILDVDEEVDIDFNNADEEMIITNSAEYGANGAQVTIENSDADVGAQMYLLDLDYTTDDDQALADYIIAQDSGGEVFRLAQNGDIITQGSIDIVGSAGLILQNDETITNAVNGTVLITGILDLASAGITNVGAIGDDAAITLISASGAVTVEGVIFTGNDITTVAGIDGSGTISANLFTPDAADGADIGSTSLEFSDVYLADGSIIKFGNDQDVTLTHVADTGLDINLAFGILDDKSLIFGTNDDWTVIYDETTNDRLEFVNIAGTSGDSDVHWDLDDDGADATFTIENTDATYEANLVVVGSISSTSSGDSYLQLTNNADIDPANNRLYFEGNELKVSENASEETILTQEDGATLTGATWDFSGTTNFKLPAAADANSEIAIDNTDFSFIVYVNSTSIEWDFDEAALDDGDVMVWSAGNSQFEPTAGAVTDVSLDDLDDPDAGQPSTFTFNADNEELTFDYTAAFTTAAAPDLFKIIQQTGNTETVTLFTLQASDSDVTVFEAGNGTSNAVLISQTGGMTFAGTGGITPLPPAADGATIGATTKEFSDLYLADSSIIYLGNDQEVKLTHVADVGFNVKHTATADDKPVKIVLQTGETDMQSADVLGGVYFQAPDEGTGTDAVLVAAGIEAVSEGDFSSSNNATKLSFLTAASEAAAEKMSLSSAGVLTVSSDIVITGNDITFGNAETISNTTDGDLDYMATYHDLESPDGTDYLRVAVANDGAAVISTTSGGTDTITIGDGADLLTIATGGWDVDSSSNFTSVGTIGCGAITSTGAFSATTGSFSDDVTITDTKSIKTGASADDYFSIETTDNIGDGTAQVEAMRVTVAGTSDAPLVELGDSGTTSPKVVTYLQAAPDAMANEGYSGTVITGLDAGEAIDQGNLVYWDSTQVEWMEADANGTGTWPARGVALTTGSNGNPLDVLVQGIMRHDDWAQAFTVGGPVYLSITITDNEGVTATAPSTAGECVQLVGWAITVDEVYFNFSGHYLEVE